MMLRGGFVSNSSSCSFTICQNVLSVEGDMCIREVRSGFLGMDNPEDTEPIEAEAKAINGYVRWEY